MIRAVCLDDAQQLVDIYNHYVANTAISFEEIEISSEEMQSRIQQALTNDDIWLVQEQCLDGQLQILGYAYTTQWKSREAYRFSYEVTIYLAPMAQGKGIGTSLYQALLEAIAKRPVKTLLAIIALPNEASIALHEKIGMTKVAHFEQVGFKFGKWVDVGYWQMTLPNFRSE